MAKRSCNELEIEEIENNCKNMRTDSTVTVVLSATDPTINLAKVNPYKIWQHLSKRIGENIEISPIGKKVKVQIPENKLTSITSLKKLTNIDVNVSKLEEYNEIRGVIHGVDPGFSEEELLEGFKECNKDLTITQVSRFKKGENPIPTIMIKMKEKSLSEFLKFGYLQFRVKEYIPRPIRCYNCQRFGHTANSCNSIKRCKKCGLNHNVEECHEQLKCPNCRGSHEASSTECKIVFGGQRNYQN